LIFNSFISLLESPRLCGYLSNPSQYYPCILNYIGLNSWSLYRCPDELIFDETSQQCLRKIPINDTFDQLAGSSSSIDDTQFQKIANFFVSNPVSNEKAQQQETNIIEPFSIRKVLNEVSSYYHKERFILFAIAS
jgi:hypothetical protein